MFNRLFVLTMGLLAIMPSISNATITPDTYQCTGDRFQVLVQTSDNSKDAIVEFTSQRKDLPTLKVSGYISHGEGLEIFISRKLDSMTIEAVRIFLPTLRLSRNLEPVQFQTKLSYNKHNPYMGIIGHLYPDNTKYFDLNCEASIENI